VQGAAYLRKLDAVPLSMEPQVRLISKDAPSPIPPRFFALVMFAFSGVIALVGARLVLATWGTHGLAPSVLFTSVGLIATVSLGVWALRIALDYVEPIRDDF
jgi:hypothetical protein